MSLGWGPVGEGQNLSSGVSRQCTMKSGVLFWEGEGEHTLRGFSPWHCLLQPSLGGDFTLPWHCLLQPSLGLEHHVGRVHGPRGVDGCVVEGEVGPSEHGEDEASDVHGDVEEIGLLGIKGPEKGGRTSVWGTSGK